MQSYQWFAMTTISPRQISVKSNLARDAFEMCRTLCAAALFSRMMIAARAAPAGPRAIIGAGTKPRLQRRFTPGRRAGSRGEGVAVVDEDRVVAGHPRPPLDRGDDGLEGPDLGLRLDPPAEQRADDALVDEVVADAELPLRRPLRHARGSAGAAGRAIERLVAVEDGVAGVGLRMGRHAGPEDMREALDGGVLRVDEIVFGVERRPQLRAPAQQVRRVDVGDVADRGLRVDDRIEIAAIGDIDHDLAEALDLRRQPRRMQIGGDVGDADAVDIGPVADIAGGDEAGGGVDLQHALFARRHQPALERHGDGPDGAVAAHGQAARGLDEEEGDVRVGARRRIQDGARHHVVATRLEHQPGADPVVFCEEMGALLDHVGALQGGAPPATRRTGLPQVCPSTQKKVCVAMGLGPSSRRLIQKRRGLKGVMSMAGCRPATSAATMSAVAWDWVMP